MIYFFVYSKCKGLQKFIICVSVGQDVNTLTGGLEEYVLYYDCVMMFHDEENIWGTIQQ